MSGARVPVLRLVGPGTRRSFLLTPGVHRVGSLPESEIRLEAPGVSRRHASLESLPDGGLVVRDLGSKNGTLVDGRKVTALALSGPATLTFGSIEASVETADASLARVAIEGTEGQGPGGRLAGPGRSTEGEELVERLTDLARRMVELEVRGEAVEAAASLVVGELFPRLATSGVQLARLAGDRREVVVAAAGKPSDELWACRAGDWRLAVNGPPPASPVAALLELLLALLARWHRTVEPAPRRRDATASRARAPGPTSLHPVLRTIYRRTAKIARGQVPVLILGESGTGKEVLARHLHAHSSRAERPFLALNCAALPRELLEAELFGIERGVATGVEARAGLLEQARGGTVFLDEIGDMPVETQAKVLRALESTSVMRVGGRAPVPVDVRFVAATHRDLEKLVAEGGFRLDLYHRLAAYVVKLPPLRERLEDLPLLAGHFFRRELAKLGVASPGITGAALSALVAYDWPGNVRELENEIAKGVLLLEPGEPLDLVHLAPRIQKGLHAESRPLTLEETVRRAEEQAFRTAQAAAEGDANKAMQLLGLAKTTYYRKLKELGLGE